MDRYRVAAGVSILLLALLVWRALVVSAEYDRVTREIEKGNFCPRPPLDTLNGVLIEMDEIDRTGVPKNELYLIDSNNNTFQKLPTLEKSWKYGAVWAPDGTYIVFGVWTPEEDSIWRVNPNGSGLQKLSDHLPKTIYSPEDFAVSPDHKSIAFELAGRIYLMDEFGENPRIIAGWPSGMPFDASASEMVPNYTFSPTFVDNGRKISFRYYVDTEFVTIGASVVNSDGQNRRYLTDYCPRDHRPEG